MIVCKACWCHAHYPSHETVDYMKQLVKKGHDTVPPKLPNMKRPKFKLEVADSWFLALYNFISEPVATESFKEDGGAFECV